MTWPPQNTGLFAVPECIACCAVAVPAPICAFDVALSPLINGAPYADLATAKDALDGTNYRATCNAYVGVAAGATLSQDTTTLDAITVSLAFTNVVGAGSFNGSVMFLPIAVAEGTVITVGWAYDSISSTGSSAIAIMALDPFGFVESYHPLTAAGSQDFAPLPQGSYVIVVSIEAEEANDTLDAVVTVSGSDTTIPLPIVASYDGQTTPLEACPTLEGVPDFGLTRPSLAAPFANQTDAQDFLDLYGVDCIGIIAPFISALVPDAASVVGSAISHNTTAASPPDITGGAVGMEMVLETGSTLTVAGTHTNLSGTGNFQVGVYPPGAASPGDNIIATGTSGAIAGTYSVTTTGKHFVYLFAANSGTGYVATATFTSDGASLVCPLQAIYDRGLQCPARLDCA